MFSIASLMSSVIVVKLSSFFFFFEQFTWCLDACIREKFVDNKRARELQGFLDGVKKGQEQVLG